MAYDYEVVRSLFCVRSEHKEAAIILGGQELQWRRVFKRIDVILLGENLIVRLRKQRQVAHCIIDDLARASSLQEERILHSLHKIFSCCLHHFNCDGTTARYCAQTRMQGGEGQVLFRWWNPNWQVLGFFGYTLYTWRGPYKPTYSVDFSRATTLYQHIVRHQWQWTSHVYSNCWQACLGEAMRLRILQCRTLRRKFKYLRCLCSKCLNMVRAGILYPLLLESGSIIDNVKY